MFWLKLFGEFGSNLLMVLGGQKLPFLANKLFISNFTQFYQQRLSSVDKALVLLVQNGCWEPSPDVTAYQFQVNEYTVCNVLFSFQMKGIVQCYFLLETQQVHSPKNTLACVSSLY